MCVRVCVTNADITLGEYKYIICLSKHKKQMQKYRNDITYNKCRNSRIIKTHHGNNY